MALLCHAARRPLQAPQKSPLTEGAAEGALELALELAKLLGWRALRGVEGALPASPASCCCRRPVASMTTSTATLTLRGAPQMLQERGG